MENNNPKISVIIPTYNRAHLLPRAIKSVLAQSFKDFELIIVDDASTDNSHEIVKNFKEKDKRIKYLKHNKNSGGPPKPKNTGIKISKGKYIAFLDSDDEWFSNKLEKQITLYKKNKNNNVGLVGCGVISINERTKEKRKIEPPTQIEVKSPKILENTIAHSCSSVIIKKTIFENIGLFDENIKVLDDRDLYIRILEKYKFLFTQEPLFHYYIHNDNVTNKKNERKNIEDQQLILKKYKKIYLKHRNLYYNKLKGIARFYMINNELRIARKIFIEAATVKPFSKIYINILLSFNPWLYKKSLLLYKKFLK